MAKHPDVDWDLKSACADGFAARTHMSVTRADCLLRECPHWPRPCMPASSKSGPAHDVHTAPTLRDPTCN